MTDVNSTIEMFVAGIVADPTTQAPVVLLRDGANSFFVPIWIGPAEATAIAVALQGVKLPRPLTHDLMFSIFSELGVKLQKVVITTLRESTYIAELVVTNGDKVICADARPSDAIALALRATVPIFVAVEVAEQAKMAVKIIEAEPMAERHFDDTVKDFQQVDKDDWTEVLERLTPADFKFKM